MKKKKYIKIKNLTINCENVNVAEKQYNTNYFSTVEFDDGSEGGGIPIIPTFDASTREDNSNEYSLDVSKLTKEVSDALEEELAKNPYNTSETRDTDTTDSYCVTSEYSGMNETIDNISKIFGNKCWTDYFTEKHQDDLLDTESHTPEEISYWTNFGSFPEDK